MNVDTDVEQIERDIFDTKIDRREVETARKSLGLPKGQYRTEPPLALIGKTDDAGRRSARFFGEVSQGGVVKGKVGFGFSPDLVIKTDDNGNESPDWNYKKYLEADITFKSTTGRDAETPQELVEFIANYPVMLTVVQNAETGESFVTKIAKARD